jgi:hypothetical protein
MEPGNDTVAPLTLGGRLEVATSDYWVIAGSSVNAATPTSGKFEKNPRQGIGRLVIAVCYVVLFEEAVASS